MSLWFVWFQVKLCVNHCNSIFVKIHQIIKWSIMFTMGWRHGCKRWYFSKGNCISLDFWKFREFHKNVKMTKRMEITNVWWNSQEFGNFHFFVESTKFSCFRYKLPLGSKCAFSRFYPPKPPIHYCFTMFWRGRSERYQSLEK